MGALVGIGAVDAEEFAALPEAVKWDVLDLLDAFNGAHGAQSPRRVLMSHAAANGHRRGWSLKSLERKFYALRDTRDWRVLVDNARAKPAADNGGFVTADMAEAWKLYCERSNRSLRSAWVLMVGDYRAGKRIGDVDWRTVWKADPNLRHEPMPAQCPPAMPLPSGWSYFNLIRKKPMRIELEAARRGRHAAKKFSAMVHTTRANMRPGEQYEFDDMWHNAMVVKPGYPKAVRPMELACIDVCSAHKVAFGLKPRLEDETGKRINIREREMRFLLAHVLCNIGYYKGGCLLLVEGGTAAIHDKLAKALHTLSGGLIKVSTSGVDRQVPLGKWGHETRGNPDHKAHIESWHNLAQNRLDHLPGYTGSLARIDKPEDHAALMRVVDKMLAVSCTLPEHLAQRLRYPVLDWETFDEVVHEVYEQIAWSSDHNLEGWQERTERQWKAHAADCWHSEEQFHRLPPEAQAALAAIITQEGFNRVARMPRAKVWERGQGDLIRLPDWAVTVICGRDLAVARSCPVTAEICFVDKEVDPEPMVYRLASCVDAGGGRVRLEEGKQYLWMINPFDARTVFVTDTFGKYVGKCSRVRVVDRTDLAAVGEEVAASRKELDAALAPMQRRAKAAARKAITDTRENARLIREAAESDARQIEAARDDEAKRGRRKAIEGFSIDDLI